MSIGILGKKVGMTRVYDDKGAATAVTVIEASPNIVTQIKKAAEKDGYNAVQIAFDEQPERTVSKPLAGHFKKAGTSPKRFLKEFEFAGEELNLGDAVTVTRFAVGQMVDVIGLSKGRGFQGVVKRHNFGGQPETHGSMMHRRAGAIGCRNKPGRIFKNKRMPGHMGQTKATVQNLRVVQVRESDNLLVIKGAIPGANGSYVIVRQAVKAKKEAAK
ncbi:MAG: 50S ribosomal protein L3 [Blastochloris sp.]|nr:50S ribosomal protein L3 [Blastochloris sp.]